MNPRNLLLTALLACLPAVSSVAADKAASPPAAKTDAEVINAARASYPLKT